MSEIEKLEGLLGRSKETGLSEALLYTLDLIAVLKNDLSNLIYSRSNYLILKYSKHTTVGGSAVEEIVVEKACAGKSVFVSMEAPGASPVTIKSAKCETGKVLITFSADPGNDHKISYMLIK